MPELPPFIESEQYQQVPDLTTSGDSTKFVKVPKSSPYEILGVSHNANPKEIKRAYREKVRIYHPDVNPNQPGEAENWFKFTSEAYQVLSNPKEKEIYDKYGWASAKKGLEPKPKVELGKTAQKFIERDQDIGTNMPRGRVYDDLLSWNMPIKVQNLGSDAYDRIVRSLNAYDTEKVCHCEEPVFRLQPRKNEPKNYCIVCHKPVVEGLSGSEKPESREGFKQLGSDVKRLPGSSEIR